MVPHFFVLPVTPMMLLGFILLMSVLNVVSRNAPAEGLVTPFGGMLAGYLFGDGSPLRSVLLRVRLKRLEAQKAALRGQSARARVGAPPLRIIHGGSKEPPKDKRYLN